MILFLDRKRRRAVEEFGVGLARDFSRRCPPALARKEAVAGPTLARAIDDVCLRAKNFRREQDLGWYGRAKFGTAFKWELKQLGYREEFVDELTRHVVILMSGT